MSFWNPEEPLGLPKGSVRAILALGVIFSSVVLLALGKIDVEQFAALTGVIVAFYFIQKTAAA